MKVQSILVSVFLLVTVPFALSQRITSSGKGIEPPRPQQILVKTNSQAHETLADILAVTPDLPRGPLDVLQEYRDQMTSVSQTLDAELAVISQAIRSGQIKRADGEYLIQQRYQLALMQYEVFSALHDSLAYEIAQTPVAAPHSQTSCGSDAILVVPGPPSTGCSSTRNRSE